MISLDLSFWRFVIIFYVARTGLWKKDGDVFFFNISTFSRGPLTALRIIFLPFSLAIGYVPLKNC